MSNQFLDLITKRRTIYAIAKNVEQSPEHLTDLIQTAIKQSPSSFNSQSSRAVILFNSEHEKFWGFVADKLKSYAKDYKYLAYINDDDFWLPDFKNLFSILDKHDDVDVVYGRVNYVGEYGEFIGEQTSSSRYKSFKALMYHKIILFTQQATLMKSQLFINQGGFDESYKLIADTNFWLKAVESGAKFLYVNKICAGYTIQPSQLSSNGALQQEEHHRMNLLLLKSNLFISNFERYLFRIVNFRIYFNRFLKHRKISSMRDFFHKKNSK